MLEGEPEGAVLDAVDTGELSEGLGDILGIIIRFLHALIV